MEEVDSIILNISGRARSTTSGKIVTVITSNMVNTSKNSSGKLMTFYIDKNVMKCKECGEFNAKYTMLLEDEQ